jgi:ABC-type cobalt transport system substrate-binding protein
MHVVSVLLLTLSPSTLMTNISICLSYDVPRGCRQSQQFFVSYSPIHITTCFCLYRPSSGEIYTVVFKIHYAFNGSALGYTVHYFKLCYVIQIYIWHLLSQLVFILLYTFLFILPSHNMFRPSGPSSGEFTNVKFLHIFFFLKKTFILNRSVVSVFYKG